MPRNRLPRKLKTRLQKQSDTKALESTGKWYEPSRAKKRAVSVGKAVVAGRKLVDVARGGPDDTPLQKTTTAAMGAFQGHKMAANVAKAAGVDATPHPLMELGKKRIGPVLALNALYRKPSFRTALGAARPLVQAFAPHLEFARDAAYTGLQLLGRGCKRRRHY